jgi:glutamate-ammonia-ligase adenylyltransferase
VLKFGARFPVLQTRSTLFQIEAASEAGVLQTEAADALRDAYTFLRRAELRLQIAHEYSAPAVKKNSREWRAWTRAVFPDETGEVAAERFETDWSTHTRAAREVFEKVRDEL